MDGCGDCRKNSVQQLVSLRIGKDTNVMRRSPITSGRTATYTYLVFSLIEYVYSYRLVLVDVVSLVIVLNKKKKPLYRRQIQIFGLMIYSKHGT